MNKESLEEKIKELLPESHEAFTVKARPAIDEGSDLFICLNIHAQQQLLHKNDFEVKTALVRLIIDADRVLKEFIQGKDINKL